MTTMLKIARFRCHVITTITITDYAKMMADLPPPPVGGEVNGAFMVIVIVGRY